MPRPDRQSQYRKRPLPERVAADEVIVASPADGEPLRLAPTSALVWTHLDDWAGWDGLDALLERSYPDVSAAERHQALAALLSTLIDRDVVERR